VLTIRRCSWSASGPPPLGGVDGPYGIYRVTFLSSYITRSFSSTKDSFAYALSLWQLEFGVLLLCNYYWGAIIILAFSHAQGKKLAQ
jgi:hypothetical protein